MFSLKLRELRQEKGYTQKQISDKTGISRSVLSQYETGHSEPTASVIIKLADALEVTTDYLLERADELDNVTVQSSAPPLPADELELLTLYRSMSNPQKRMFVAYGEGLTEPLATNRKPQ